MQVIHFDNQDNQSLWSEKIPPTLLSWQKIKQKLEEERLAKLAELEA